MSKGEIGNLEISHQQTLLVTTRGVGIYGQEWSTVIFHGIEYKNYCSFQ